MANVAPVVPEMPPVQQPVDMDRKYRLRPIRTRLWFWLQLWALKIVVRSFVLTRQLIQGQKSSTAPTYYKTYPSKANISARVFIPKTWKPGDAPLPLIIDIHGGGFAIGAPMGDDRDNAGWAHEHGFVVVSIGYRLAPSHPYPAAVEDISDQIEQILEDTELPVDFSRVATLGYSAGGNLALAAPQRRGLHKRIAAAVCYYPAVDMVIQHEEREKQQVRHPDGRADPLKTAAVYFSWGYVRPGSRLKDPQLSPRFAPRELLPRHIYLLGAEYDMLCNDAWRMAEELAEKEEGNEKVYDERGGDKNWECGTIRWKRVLGVEHGFNQTHLFKKKDEAELFRRKQKECQLDVADWLRRGPFAEKKK